jgi:hypothetical protein
MTKFSATFIQASSFWCVNTRNPGPLSRIRTKFSAIFIGPSFILCQVARVLCLCCCYDEIQLLFSWKASVKWRGHHGKVVHASLVHLLLCAYFRCGLPDEESLVWSTSFLTIIFIQLIMIFIHPISFFEPVLFNKG